MKITDVLLFEVLGYGDIPPHPPGDRQAQQVEYLTQHQPYKQYFHKPYYQPEQRMVKLPDLPGLGLLLDEERIEQRRDYQPV